MPDEETPLAGFHQDSRIVIVAKGRFLTENFRGQHSRSACGSATVRRSLVVTVPLRWGSIWAAVALPGSRKSRIRMVVSSW
jgi:hypothetical protein